ncbi:Aldo/keto reductase family [Nesidiocoris tenuis]|uniref:Aldo/keto reductase family n=1 Tax=Nesidiocoris tenuis TaxID=355587 RepID=A0ABN7B4T5_9HEMI|nr:Aldo/keto reductase family [Nesidiocoris tenuis]
MVGILSMGSNLSKCSPRISIPVKFARKWGNFPISCRDQYKQFHNSPSSSGVLDKVNPFKKNSSSVCPPVKCCDDVIRVGGVEIPMYGYGTWQLETDLVDSSIEYALDTGIRHIDTSITFGNVEAIGRALEKLFKCGKYCREELFLSGKLPNFNMKPEDVYKVVSSYLEGLKVKYLDLFMIQFPVGVIVDKCCGEYVADPYSDILAIWKEMEKQVEEKRVKALGVSNFNIRQIHCLMECSKIPPANLQTELHVYNQDCELVKAACRCGISVTAYAPLGSPSLVQHLYNINGSDNNVGDPLMNNAVERIGRKYGKTSANVLLRFLLQKGIIVIPKSSKPDRICSNFNVFDFELDACDIEELGSLDKGKYGRMFTDNVWQGTSKHPEYPFPKT